MGDQILYDLIVYEEWMREPQVLHQVGECFWQHRGPLINKLWKVTKGSTYSMLKTLKTQFRFQTSFGCPPQHLITLQNNKLSWDLAVSSDGMLVAILQDDNIEIRTVSDNFSSVIGNFPIEKEGLPQWRKIAWSDHNSLLAYSNSFGDVHIFHLRSERKCVVPQPLRSGLNVPGTLSQAIAFLKFVPCKEEEWDAVLYVSTYQGYLNCYYLKGNLSAFKEKCSLSLLPYHPYGIASMEFDSKNQLLMVAGNYGEEPYISDKEPCYGSHCGISVWRLLTDVPYFSLVEDHGKGFKKVSTKQLLTKLVLFRRKEAGYLRCGIYNLYLSPDAAMLVSLHLDGRISLWNVPSFRLYRTWHKSEQPDSSYLSEGSKVASSYNNNAASNVVDMKWWSDKELVLARGSGVVTVSLCETLLNLLGESPERFECWPSLSEVVDGHVLVLECETAITTPGEKSDGASKKWLSEEDEEDLYSLRLRLKELTKQVLYFLTDAETFLPHCKPPKILTNTYRLVCLKSTTPEELYARKIDLEHYGEALDLAQRFGLNTDLVYQRQWRKKPVTMISIHDYLTKIKDRYWVLDECLLRIPDDFDSAEHLLKYGLLGTCWEVIQQIDVKDEEEIKYFIEPELDVDDGVSKRKYSGLSPKQLRLCRYRLKLLQYLDRLSTYELILGDSSKTIPGDSYKAREKFSAKYFSHFRCCNIVHQALTYARDEDSIALEHLFSYYGKYILPHWLPVLSNFPETAEVCDLDHVIPEIGETEEDPEILPWPEMFHRDQDWVEQNDIIHHIYSEVDNDIGSFIYDSQPELKEFRNCQSKTVLRDWFVKRAYEIEERSKQVDKSCELLELGIKRGISGLTGLLNNLQLLLTLTYEVNIDSSLGLSELTTLSHLSKLKLLMSKSMEESFVNDFRKFVLPYLNKIGIKSISKKNDLTHQFLMDIAKTDLTCCFKLFSESSPSQLVCEPIIPDVALLMKLAMDCILICKRDDQLDLVFHIVECLPNREEGVLSSEVDELHNQLDQLKLIVAAAGILEEHAYPLTISYIHENKDDAIVAEDIVQELIKSTVLKSPAATPAEWNTLLEHLIKLAKDVFRCVDVKRCHEMFVKGLLHSGSKQNINVAQELLTPSRHGSLIKTKEQYLRSALYVLKYDVSVNLIVETASEYFNSAAFLRDEAMELASLCLSLITDKPNVIEEELDLIKSLGILEEFNVTMLPLQVRLCPDRFDIIDKCLKEKSTSYKKRDKLLLLGDLLKICGDDENERNGEIRIKVAEKALEHHDYIFASNVCHQLINDRYERGWKICQKLGMHTEYINFSSREKLLSFAMTFCPAVELETILNANTLLKTQILYDKLRLHVNENLTEDDVKDGDESLVKSTTKKTMRLLSSVKDINWIEQAMKWTSSDSDILSLEKDVSETLQCHPFYETVCANNHISKYDLDEFSTLLEGTLSKGKVFNELMLRSQKLSERRAEGNVVEDTDQALLCLSNIEFSSESMMSLSYLLALRSTKAEQDFFDKQKRTKFMLRFSSYYYALQLYTIQNKLIMPSLAPVYTMSHKELVNEVLGKMESEGLEANETSKLLLMYLKTLADMQQAEMLQSLGKGVDVERFSHDDSYKKETILGLAMNLDDQVLNICFQLAEKYHVEMWEVLLSHVEFLFTESGLKGNGIRDELKKWNIEEKLKTHGDEVFDRLTSYVYPEIDGTDHNKLLLFYVLLSTCTSPSNMLGGTLSLDSHVKILKKIKAAAQKMDYKALVHGDSPLDVIAGAVRENNVHLLAKISSKVPLNDGTFLSPQKVFLAYLKRAFHNPERAIETLDWIHHFETYQKILPKLNLVDIAEFADHITFTEEAFSRMTVEVRIDITNRLLKFVRQKNPQGGVGKGATEIDKELLADQTSTILHLEQSLKHLKSLQGQTFLDFIQSASTHHQAFAKQFDLSRGDSESIKNICITMFKNLESPLLISQILSLNESSPNVSNVFKDALKELLNDIQCTDNFSNLRGLIDVIKESSEECKATITAEDFLEVIRPFCSSQNVDSQLKSEVLRLLRESFQLSEEDIFLLMWLQTDSVITSKWNMKITREEIDTCEKRNKLFSKLLTNSSSEVQTAGLEELLCSWALQDDTANYDVEMNPWVRFILKRIDIGEFDLILLSVRLAEEKTMLEMNDYNIIYSKLKELGEHSVGFKVLLSTRSLESSNIAFKDLFGIEDIQFDEELVRLLVDSDRFCQLVKVPLYEKFVNNLLSVTDISYVDRAIKKLRDEGFYAEAGTLFMKLRGFHPSLCTFYNAFEITKWKLYR